MTAHLAWTFDQLDEAAASTFLSEKVVGFPPDGPLRRDEFDPARFGRELSEINRRLRVESRRYYDELSDVEAEQILAERPDVRAEHERVLAARALLTPEEQQRRRVDGAQQASEAESQHFYAMRREGLAWAWPMVCRAWREHHRPELAARSVSAQRGGDLAALELRDARRELQLELERRLPRLLERLAVPADLDSVGMRGEFFALDAALYDAIEAEGFAEDAALLRAQKPPAAPGPSRWADPVRPARVLARVVWARLVLPRVSGARDRPLGLTRGVSESIADLARSRPEVTPRDGGGFFLARTERPLVPIAEIATLPAEVLKLALLSSRYTLPFIEWLIETTHRQHIAKNPRADRILIPQGGWQRVAELVLEHPASADERSQIRKVAELLAHTQIRWSDGVQASSLFLFEADGDQPTFPGQPSRVSFKVTDRLLVFEADRTWKQMARRDIAEDREATRIVPLVRPRLIAPLPHSSPNTFGAQMLFPRRLQLLFVERREELHDLGAITVSDADAAALADESALPGRLAAPLLEHLVKSGALISPEPHRFAPGDERARKFIADGVEKSRGKSAKEIKRRAWRAKGSK